MDTRPVQRVGSLQLNSNAEVGFLGCFGFFGSLRCRSRLPTEWLLSRRDDQSHARCSLTALPSGQAHHATANIAPSLASAQCRPAPQACSGRAGRCWDCGRRALATPGTNEPTPAMARLGAKMVTAAFLTPNGSKLAGPRIRLSAELRIGAGARNRALVQGTSTFTQPGRLVVLGHDARTGKSRKMKLVDHFV